MSLLHGDCLELLPTVADGSVDMVFADLPYGVTANKWDSVIPFEPLWAELLRVGKRNAAFVFTATFDFAVALRNAQKKLRCYEMFWHKNCPVGFFNASKRPLTAHEIVLVFYREQPTYNPQKTFGHRRLKHTRPNPQCGNYGSLKPQESTSTDESRHPTTVIYFSREEQRGSRFKHPTQKPVALLEWLIRTYSNPGDTVLDPTMGSGTTGVACINTGRQFIGIEKDATYYATAQRRLAEAQPPLTGVA